MLEMPSRLRADRIVELRIAPMPGGGVSVSLTDITERRQNEIRLRTALDQSAEILESISDAFYAVDAGYRFTYVNKVAETWWGRSRGSLIGKVFWDEFPSSVGSVSQQAHFTAMREREVVRLETLSSVINRWIDISIFPTESGLSVYFRDIAERKMAERRQQLLVNELNHRVKNTLSVVQALIRRTLGGARSLGEARDALTARLMALSDAHDLITRENWTGASLGDVVARSVLRQLDRPERILLDGPAVTVSPKLAVSLSLALHELMTNALKYGALSYERGRVSLTWRLDGEPDAQRLKLVWREIDGPLVTTPERRGFGSRLIERGLSTEVDGPVTLAFEPDGVVCEIDAALTQARGLFGEAL
jgi:PAS domain S-box-containing protein